jgi:predicted ester cyclase
VRSDRVEFPDGVATVEDQIAEGDRVLTRWRFHGTNTGSVEGNPATGREVSVSGFHLYRIVDGRIVEVRAQPEGPDHPPLIEALVAQNTRSDHRTHRRR